MQSPIAGYSTNAAKWLEVLGGSVAFALRYPSITMLRHTVAPTAIVILLLLAACSDDPESCTDCAATEENFGLTQRTVHDARSETFHGADGVAYTLVRVEYGDTPECSDWDDEDCWYSTYCGFVVENVDFPLEVYWVTEEDALFDPAEFCEDGELEGCELPGQLLPILEDEDFETWIYETDPEENVLVDCFAEYW